VLEGGAEAAHGDWWESAVEWLAGGLTRDALVSGGTVQPYTVWEGRLEGRVPSALTVRFDDGAAGLDILRIARDRGVVRFVPTVTGAHTFSAAEESALGATVVLDGTERLTWAGAALEVGGGAGALIPANDAATVDGTPLDSGDGRSWLFFLFLTALMGAGWTVRRLQGLG
jgi:hypothetical protein